MIYKSIGLYLLPLLLIASSSCLQNDKGTRAKQTTEKEAPSSPDAMKNFYHKGVNHAHMHRRGNGYGSAPSAKQHDWFADIGINAIAITPFGYQRGAKADHIVGYTGTEVVGTDPTMTDEDIGAEIDSAHQRGIRVMLKPHIWSNDFWNGDEWHGTVDQNTPEAHRGWWKSYKMMALHYAKVAEKYGADFYCIGTELATMTLKYPDEWRELITEIRSEYTGPLTYAAHWDKEFPGITFWDQLDFIGVTAYFPLDAPDTASTSMLVEAWQTHRERIASIAQKFDRPIVFLEAGYRPVLGTHREPWLYDGGENDPDSQGRAFEALLKTFSDDDWFHGVYIWKTFTDPLLARSGGENTGFMFRDLPGEKVLRDYWKK